MNFRESWPASLIRAIRTGRAAFDPDGQHQLDQGEDQGRNAQLDMQHESGTDEHRDPWQVIKGQNSVAGDELAQGHQILQGLIGVGPPLPQVRGKPTLEDLEVDLIVELDTQAHQQARTQPFGKGGDQEEQQDQQGQHNQRDFVLADHDAVVDLQHVEGGRER